MNRLTLSALAVVASLSLVACGGPEAPNTDPDAGTEQNPLACGDSHATVTSQQLFDSVVNAQCASCHFPGNVSTALELNTNAALLAAVGAESTYGNGMKVVEANHPENSTFYLKSMGGQTAGVKGPGGHSVGGRMPEGGSLTDEEKQMIQDWICSGAQ